MKTAGYYKGYVYPKDKPHWTAILKQLITDTKYKGTWKEAIKDLWQPFKKNTIKTSKKEVVKPSKAIVVQKEVQKEAQKVQVKPSKAIVVQKVKKVELKKVKDDETDDGWKFYGKFGVNVSGYKEYHDYIKKIFTSPGKILKNDEWAEIQMKRKNFYDNQNQFDYYPTPVNIVDKIMMFIEDNDVLNIKKDHNVHMLEPSAGTGSIIKGFIEKFGSKTDRITANEYRDDNLLKKLLINVDIKHGDFLKMHKIDDLDLIIMNPPFNREGKNDDYFMEHIAHGMNMLKRYGHMIVICPAFHDAKKEGEDMIVNSPFRNRILRIQLHESSKITEPMLKRMINNKDITADLSKGKYENIDMRHHQVSLLGYTKGEFGSIVHDKNKDVYKLDSLDTKIAIYLISVI